MKEWWINFLGSLTTEKLLVISFVLTFIVVVAINAWLEAYGLALTLIATNKVSQRSASSSQLIINEVKVIYLFALICLRLIFIQLIIKKYFIKLRIVLPEFCCVRSAIFQVPCEGKVSMMSWKIQVYNCCLFLQLK